MDVKVALSGEMAAFAASRLSEGRYSSMSEMVDEALRLLERVEAPILDEAYLRQAWQEGIDSGDAGEVDIEDIKKEGRALLGR